MLIERIYKQKLVHRYDDNGYIKYFTADDFPGVTGEPFSFRSGENMLRGFFYRCENAKNELIVFCHGIGGGHRSYMTEIALLCRRGYTVLAYDNTGCFASEGKDIRGFTQSLADLDAAFTELKARGTLRDYRRVFVIGHSWGGYAAANIPAFQTGIDKCAAISGFVSVEKMLLAQAGGGKGPANRYVYRRLCGIERRANPKYFGANAPDAVNGSKTKFLFAHSEDDPTVAFADHTGYIMQSVGDKAEYLIVNRRFHNPNYTEDAVKYLAETFGGFEKAQKEGRLKTLADKQNYFAGTDWRRMTAQDEAFWDRVCAFLDKEN